jgi:hypothetical protein
VADDEMKRWLEEAKKVQVRPSLSHARTKPVVVEKLKTRTRRAPDRARKSSRLVTARANRHDQTETLPSWTRLRIVRWPRGRPKHDA